MDALSGARVLDLFAGSGALGIEALSRGAGHATFVDADGAALRSVRANLDATGLAGRADVVRSDALAHLRAAGPGDGSPVDLVLVDPPYAFDHWPELLDAVASRWPGAVVVAESDRDVEPPAEGIVLRRRRYGGTVVTFMTLTGDGSSPTTEDAT
jgi:16S rRNA (guanine966-N2)-methyltransferase